MSSMQKIKNLEFLRIIGCLAIIFVHLFSNSKLHQSFADISLYHTLYNMTNNGQKAVDLFFILSGFLMILSYFDSDRITGCSVIYNFRFAAGKLKKLYLLHIVMTFVAIPIRAAECEGAYFNLGFIRDLVLNIFLLH